jgi:nitrate reductase gamma subunit
MGFTIEQMHVYALVFMAIVYCIRIVWIMRFRLVRDRARPRGSGLLGAAVAMTTMFRPWSMETTRQGFVQWLEFAVFHIGIGVMIGTSFVISLAHQWLTPPIVALIIVSQALALVAGILRLIKRVREPTMRAINSPDDYFSLVMINLLFIACALATFEVPLVYEGYFVLLAIIIAYVPFSKISHYLYYPIARYFYGSYLGRRGIVR